MGRGWPIAREPKRQWPVSRLYTCGAEFLTGGISAEPTLIIQRVDDGRCRTKQAAFGWKPRNWIVIGRRGKNMVLADVEFAGGLRTRSRASQKDDVVDARDSTVLPGCRSHQERAIRVSDGRDVRILVLVSGSYALNEAAIGGGAFIRIGSGCHLGETGSVISQPDDRSC